MNESTFMFPIEHLQNLIDQISKGIEPAMTDLEKLEVKKLYKMQSENLFDDDGEGLTAEEEAYRQKMIKQSIEEQKRKARKTDVVVIKLTQEQHDQLVKEMSSSLVRPNPNLLYHKTNDELYKSAEEKVIDEKLKRIRNCYYDADEWRRVILLIQQAVELKLRGTEFAYFGSYEKRVQAFNEGKIKLKVPVPKLYLNRISPVTDPELLKGILTGDVQVVDRAQSEKNITRKSYRNSPLVEMYVPEISEAEHNYYVDMHRKGFETPESPAIRAKSTVYDRYINPVSTKKKAFGILDNNGVPIQFDWLGQGPEEYYRRLHGLTTTIDDIVENLQKSNDGKIGRVLSDKMHEFVSSYKNGGIVEDKPNWMSASVQVSPTVVKMEQDLLRAIQLNNPGGDTIK